jgi:Zn-dependent membrane protease YugP
MKLDKNQRHELGKALYDVGKLTLTGLVLGQLIGKSINFLTFILGIAIFIACFWIGTILMKEE